MVSLSCSGGEALLVADTAAGRDIDFRPFSAADEARIRPTVNPIVALTNPFDYHTFDWAKRERLETTFTEVLKSGFDLGFLVLDIPRLDRCDDREYRIASDAFIAAAKVAGARAGILATLNECMPDTHAAKLTSAGLVPFMGISETLTAIEKAAFIGRAAGGRFEPLGAGAAPKDVVALTEWEAKLELQLFGLPLPSGRLVRQADEARKAFADLGGPVVVKACSRDLLHKTEAGAVRLNLRTADDVAAAVMSMAKLAKAFIVEEMVTDGIAELIVGVKRDPQVGLVLVVGSGGVLVELIGDARTLLFPVSPADAERALLSLKAAKLMQGFRGRPKGDVAAAVAAILAVARYAEANATTLAELDINPLIVRPEGKGAAAVDALIRRSELRVAGGE